MAYSTPPEITGVLVQERYGIGPPAPRHGFAPPFTTLSHEWLVKFVEHRIADRRVVRHIKKWLNAGVLEDGKRMQVEEGTPQGGSISWRIQL
jgi:hypothetical protein